MSTILEKKKPGRPKKTINLPSVLAIEGISKSPTNKENILEIVYDNPKVFKKIFLLDRSYMVNEIYMNFEPESFIIASQNHTKTIIKQTVFDCAQLNHYYCKSKVSVAIKRDSLEKIFKNLDKSQYKITFVLKDDFRKKIYLQVKDYEINSESFYDIEVVQIVEQPNTEPFKNINDYPLKFELSGKGFKRTINNFGAHSNTLTFRKNGNDSLTMTYDIVSNRVLYNEVFLDEQAINLKSTIEKDDILSVSLEINDIKPFSNACIGDNITIMVDKSRPLCLMTALDRGGANNAYICHIYALIDICK